MKKNVAEILEISIDNIKESDDLALDLGAEQLDFHEIKEVTEESFDILMLDKTTHNLNTIGDLIDYVENMLEHNRMNPTNQIRPRRKEAQ